MYEEQDRCPVCDRICVSCAVRRPELDTPYGPLCGWCVGAGQAEPYTEQCPEHERYHGQWPDAGSLLAGDQCMCPDGYVLDSNEHGDAWCGRCGERLLLPGYVR